MAAPVVMVCGSRSLSQAASRAVGQVVPALLGAGSVLSVGCASGADAAAVSSATAQGAGSRLQLFAVGGQGGAGFAGRASALPGVRAASVAGARVTWWAGGPPSVPLRARLARRSLACVRSVLAGGPGSGLVAFVSRLPSQAFGSGAWPSCGSGTWSAVAAAARAGLPVVVVPVGGVSGCSLPGLPGGGSWVAVGLAAQVGGFRWVPAPSLFAG